MNRFTIGVTGFVFMLGCGPTPALQPSADGNAKQESQQESDEESLRRLISNSWTSRSPNANPLLADHVLLRFHIDGTYAFEYRTDYDVPIASGRWTIVTGPDGVRLLAFDNGLRKPFTFARDGTLQFYRGTYYPSERVAVPQRISVPPAVATPAEVLKMRQHLSANAWQKANDLNLYRLPTRLHFHPDGSYEATYRYTECLSRGIWQAASTNLFPWVSDPLITGHNERSKCDTRGAGREDLQIKIADGEGLLVNHVLYVPEAKPAQHGVIRALFGFSDVVRVTVRYEMPVRQHEPNLFDVEFHCLDVHQAPITLQRLSLTDSYDHAYRRPNHQLSKVNEIAAIDLGNHLLLAGETHRVQLTVTFPKSGPQMLYINAMMFGRSQDWDSRSSYEFRIRPASGDGD